MSYKKKQIASLERHMLGNVILKRFEKLYKVL